MNHLKKMFFAVAAVVVLGLFGTGSALAQCTQGVVTSTSPQVRSEATVELLGSVTITCNAAFNAANIATQASLSLALNPASTVFVATSATPDNMSTFPRPTVIECTAANAAAVAAPNTNTCIGAVGSASVAGLTVIGSGTNSVTFIFTPAVVGDQVITVTGIRANVNSSGLTNGSTIQATAVTGGSISATTNTLNIAVVNQGLSTSTAGGAIGSFATGFSSGFPGGIPASFPLNIAQCGPTVRPPTSATATTATVTSFGTAPLGLGLTNALTVNLREGFTSAWQVVETDSGPGSGIAADPTIAVHGTRFRIVLSGVPTGAQIWAPETVAAGVLGTTGAVSVATVAVSLVSGANPDGSGGTVLAAPVANQFDRITVSSGTATIIYEVTLASLVATEGVSIQIPIAAPTTVGVGAITGSVGFAAVGPPTLAPARPQFAAATSRTVANISICATYLLFPWVAYDARGSLDTGFAISNSTADPAVIGTAGQSGAVTMYFFASNGGPNPAPVALTPPGASAKAGDPVGAGQTVTYVLSQLTPGTAFFGYAVAVCNFQLGHGFAFFNNPQPGTGGAFAEGYLAVVIGNPRLGPPFFTPTEFGGR
jgi:hypothetical protein